MSLGVRIVPSLFAWAASLTLLGGCAVESPSHTPLNTTPLRDCPEAFRAWIRNAESLNSPEADIDSVLMEAELIEREVFDVCTLEAAEQLNQEVLLEIAPGVRRPMIEPDFRTFADVECVDESPLLDGTPLCAEVGH